MAASQRTVSTGILWEIYKKVSEAQDRTEGLKHQACSSEQWEEICRINDLLVDALNWMEAISK